MSGFYPLAVTEVRGDTRDAIVVSFAVPPEHAERFRHTQGQFLTFRTELGGEELRRSYSICSGMADPLRVAIKRVHGGAFSSWAHEHLKPGMTIAVAPPDGRFHVPLAAGNAHHYLGFAAGSGITPLISIMKTTLAVEPESHFTLVYGNRASSSVMFRDELQDLKDRYLDRVALIFVMSREHQDVELLNGRIDREKCEQLFTHWIDLGGVDTTFVCGPADMAVAVTEALAARGVAAEQIKVEYFGTPGARQRPRRPAEEDAAGVCRAAVTFEGARHEFLMPKNGEPLLDAALRHGIDLPYSCRSGVCGTCRATLVSGEVDIDVHYALEDYEIRHGAILMCQSYPVTDEVAVTIDR